MIVSGVMCGAISALQAAKAQFVTWFVTHVAMPQSISNPTKVNCKNTEYDEFMMRRTERGGDGQVLLGRDNCRSGGSFSAVGSHYPGTEEEGVELFAMCSTVAEFWKMTYV